MDAEVVIQESVMLQIGRRSVLNALAKRSADLVEQGDEAGAQDYARLWHSMVKFYDEMGWDRPRLSDE